MTFPYPTPAHTGPVLLVTGSRDWVDEDAIVAGLVEVLVRYRPETFTPRPDDAPPIAAADMVTLRHGRCRGADLIAHKVWRQWANRGLVAPPQARPADWRKHGPLRAGPIRNAEMVAELPIPFACAAFPLGPSHGTRGAMQLAAKAGIPVMDFGTPR